MKHQIFGLLALMMLASSAAAQTQVPGWTYEVAISLNEVPPGWERGQVNTLRIYRSGHLWREELRTPKGLLSTRIWNDSANPLFELSSLAPTVTKQEIEDLGPSDTILGHPTRHYRVTMAGSAMVRWETTVNKRALNGVSEYWVAADIPLGSPLDTVLVLIMRGGTHEQTDMFRRLASGARLPSGTPLRIISRGASESGQGGTITETVHYQVVEVKQGMLDAALFVAGGR